MGKKMLNYFSRDKNKGTYRSGNGGGGGEGRYMTPDLSYHWHKEGESGARIITGMKKRKKKQNTKTKNSPNKKRF